MRLLLYSTMLMTLFWVSSLTAHAQTNAPLPPTAMLIISGEQLGTADMQAVAYADLDQDGDHIDPPSMEEKEISRAVGYQFMRPRQLQRGRGG